MKTTFKVSYYLRSNYENKEGKSPVMLRIYLGGEKANLGSTKIFVDKSKWSNKTSRMIGRTAEALSINASIDALTTTLMQIYRKYETSEELSIDLIRSVFLGTDKEYMVRFAHRLQELEGYLVSTDSPEAFLADLIRHGFVNVER